MKVWGYTFGAELPGWRWMKDTPAMAALRCRVCNTYPDEVIYGYRPTGDHLDDITDSVRAAHIVTANDGFAVFDDGVRARLIERWVFAESLTYRAGPGVWTFDLPAMEKTVITSLNSSQAVDCPGCGRWSPLFVKHDSPGIIMIDREPSQAVVRSDQLTGRAYLRRPDIFASNEVFSHLGLPRDSHEVCVE
jgi:hypothetical protein